MKKNRLFSALCFALLVAFLSPLQAAEWITLSAERTITITDVTSQTKVSLQRIDLQSTNPPFGRGDLVSIEIEVTTNATAPGSSRTLTAYYGLATGPSSGTAYTAAQIATATSNQVLALPTTSATVAVYTLPIGYQNTQAKKFHLLTEPFYI